MNVSTATSLRYRALLYITAGLLAIASQACTVSYSTSGASIPPDAKTVSVDYFDNFAPIIQPGLSQELTDAVRDEFINQTNLEMISGPGDLHFEGKITDYVSKPMELSGDQRAINNRLTIQVEVKFTNSIEPENNFEKSFSRYADYDSNLNLEAVQAELHEEIIEQLVQDIFNASVVNW